MNLPNILGILMRLGNQIILHQPGITGYFSLTLTNNYVPGSTKKF